MDFKDYYSTLGVAKTATEKEIKQAYRKLARKHHPDVNPGDKAAEARFKEINEAYEVLGDPDKRKKYDELGANWRMYEQAQQQASGPGGASVRRRRGTSTWAGRRRLPHDDRRGDARDVRRRGSVLRLLPDLFRRRRRRSDGAAPAAARRAHAEGPRHRARDRAHARGGVPRRHAAHVDQARRPRAHASTCGFPPASGKARASASPAKAKQAPAAAPAGDLYLRVRIPPHPVFERKGNDLHTRWRAGDDRGARRRGGGADDRRQIGAAEDPADDTQNGQVFRLKGHGMPVVGKPDERGDLYATRRRRAAPRADARSSASTTKRCKKLDAGQRSSHGLRPASWQRPRKQATS